MIKLKEKQKSIISAFQNNFDRLTYAQQSVMKRYLEKDDVLAMDTSSLKSIVAYYVDSHSDYSDAF